MTCVCSYLYTVPSKLYTVTTLHSVSICIFTILHYNSKFFLADLYLSKYYMHIEKYLRKDEYFILFAYID